MKRRLLLLYPLAASGLLCAGLGQAADTTTLQTQPTQTQMAPTTDIKKIEPEPSPSMEMAPAKEIAPATEAKPKVEERTIDQGPAAKPKPEHRPKPVVRAVPAPSRLPEQPEITTVVPTLPRDTAGRAAVEDARETLREIRATPITERGAADVETQPLPLDKDRPMARTMEVPILEVPEIAGRGPGQEAGGTEGLFPGQQGLPGLEGPGSGPDAGDGFLGDDDSGVPDFGSMTGIGQFPEAQKLLSKPPTGSGAGHPSYRLLYGGVVPGKSRDDYSGQGGGGSGDAFYKTEAEARVWDVIAMADSGGESVQIYEYEGDYGYVAVIGGTLHIQVSSDGDVNTEIVSGGGGSWRPSPQEERDTIERLNNAGGGGQTVDGGGGDVSPRGAPISMRERKDIERARLRAIIANVLGGPKVTGGGDPIDPIGQSASTASSSEAAASSATGGQAKEKEQKNYAGKKPGGDLVGPTRLGSSGDEPKALRSDIKGFHVIDPIAADTDADTALDESMGILSEPASSAPRETDQSQ